MRSTGIGIVAGLSGLAFAAGTASATWSIVIVDTRTGEVAAGSATCLTNINLRNETPVIILGRGAATAQALLEPSGVTRSDLRQGLLLGQDPASILATLAANDSGHQSRQYGLVDVLGRSMTFSGTSASDWKGGVTGRIERGRPGPDDDIVYAVQGNILTGEGVVLAAEQAILASPGDVADMLMDGMVAARVTGGDGRCSCTTGGPTSCGTPPSDNPDDFKSAHVGYMLVGRLGDLDGSRALYRAFEFSALQGFDLDADGRDELLAFTDSSKSVRTYAHLDASVPGAIAVEDADTLTFPMNGARATARGDVTGDGAEDLLVVSGGNSLWVIPGLPAGGLDPDAGSQLPGVSGIVSMTLLDLDGLGGRDVALLLNDGSVLPVAGGAGSSLAAGTPVVAGLGVTGPLRAGDLDNDGDDDLVAISVLGAGVELLTNNADGSLTPAGSVPTAAAPLDARVADLDADGSGELVVIETGNNDLQTYNADGSPRAGIRVGFSPTRFIDAEIDAGVAGEFAVSGNRRVSVFAPDGAGGLLSLGFESLNSPLRFPAALDLNADGLDELAGAGDSNGDGALLVLVENRGGEFFEPRGWGDGNYWLALNVANTAATDPDPVGLLQERFDRWRDTRAGHTDAVLSTVDTPHAQLAPGESVTLTATLVAYPGVPITAAASVGASTEDASVAEVLSVEMTGNDTARVTVRAIGEGRTRVLISVDDGLQRPVVLMPAPTVEVIDNPLDLNGDGVVDQADLKAFIQAFVSGDPAADIDGDGFVGHGDVAAFIRMWQEETGRARGRFKHAR